MKNAKRMTVNFIGIIGLILYFLSPAFAGEGINTGDSYDDELWGHKKIKISDAWDEGKGAGITVAVIDTGIDYNHIDLCNSTDCNINKVNSGYGVNFLVEEGSSERNEVMDKNGHGTHIAGIISAIENSKGVVGLAPKAKILALKAIADDGTGDIADIAEAITYAADNEADVIICSFGSVATSADTTLKTAVEYAYDKGCVIVVPAGNDDEDSGYSTLAQYPEAIVVSASTKKDRKYPASNWGTRIALAAPGEKILSTMTSDSSKDYQSDKEEDGYNYTYLSGTHQAAAYVAGTAACMLSKKDSLKPEQIRWILRASSDDANSEVLSGWDLYFGDGRLNAKEALKKVKNGNYPAKSSRATITAPEFKEELEKGSHKIKAKAKGVTYKLEYAKASFNLKENSLENADVSGSYTFCEIIPWQGSVDADADKIATWDTSEIIKDGNYILRLYVNDDTGCTLTDNLRVAVNNDYFGITSPQDNAIMSAKNKIKIKGNANGSSCSSYEVAYSTDKCNWTTIKTSNTSVTNGTLATWDVPALNLSGIKKYHIQLKATYADTIYTTTAENLYLDPNLNISWPQEIEIVSASEIDAEKDLAPAIEDIDADDSPEIILLTTGKDSADKNKTVPKIYVYGSGTQEAEIAFSDLEGGNVLAPASIGDVRDGDGKKDEIISVINRKENGQKIGYIRIYDYSSQETLDFKIEDVEIKGPAIIADLENDGTPELVVTSNNYLHIGQFDSVNSKYYNYRYEIGSHSFDDYYRMPVVGNLDSDDDLEIAVWGRSDKKDTIRIFDYDSVNSSSYITESKKWDVGSEDIIIVSLTAGDINEDDSLDIVVAGEKYYESSDEYKGWIGVYGNDGSALSGWPREEDTAYEHYPAIFDFDKDGDLEIAILDMEGELRIYYPDGTSFTYLPSENKDTALTGLCPVVGDLDGDNASVDIISPINHYFYAQAIKSDDKSASDIKKGRVTNIAPLVTFNDIDGDGKTEIIATSIDETAYNAVNENYKTKGYIYAWDLKSDYRPDFSSWPTFQNNNQRTGSYSNPDKTAPEISVEFYTSTKDAGGKKYTNSTSQLTLDITVKKEEGSGIKEYSYQVQYKNTNDGSYTDVITGDSSGTFNDFDEVFENKDITSLSLADATTYRVALKATDNAGNTSEEAYSDDITTDIAKPTDPADIKVNNTSADVSVSADFSLSWTASTDSGSGIKEYSYELKDLSGNSKKSGTATSASTTISISGLSDADYYFYVKVKDYAGNESNSAQSSKITLSTAAPAKPSGISIKYTGKSDTYSYNTNDKYYYVNDATFDASWTGSSSKYEYRIITKKNDDKVKATLVNLTETTLTTVNTSIPSSTTNGTIVYFQVRAKDSAGNTSDYAEQKIKYDKTNIITGDMSLTVPSKISSTSQIDVTFSAKDTESGVWNYAYIISTSSSDPSSGDWDEAYASTSGASGLKSKVDAGNKTPNKKDKTKKTITGLALTDGSTYYLHSRAKNGAGKWSSTKTSGSIKVSKSKQKAKK